MVIVLGIVPQIASETIDESCNEAGCCRIPCSEGKGRQSEKERAKKKKLIDDKAEELLGGAIDPKRVRFKDIESRAPETDNMDKIMREQAFLSGPPRMQEFMHGVTDYRPLNNIGYWQYDHEWKKHSEQALHKSAMKLLSGDGAKGDHPRIQKLVHETLGHMPELLHLYSRA